MAIINKYPPPAFARESLELQRAQALLGDVDISWFFDDLFRSTVGWTEANVNTGDIITAAEGPGVVRVTSGATASSQARMYPGDAAAHVTIPNGTGSEWYIAARLQTETTLDTAMLCGVISREAGGAYPIRMGAFGAVSATNWSVAGTVGSIDSGTAIVQDQWDIVRAWRKSSTTYIQVNEGAITSGNVYPDVSPGGHLFIISENGATAANRAFVIDWVAVAGVRSTF